MNFKELQLPGLAIAEIYKTLLIELPPPESQKNESNGPQNPEPATDPLVYLGQNLRNVLVMVNYSGYVYLPEEQLLFLTNILKACQLNLADIAILNTSSRQVNFERLNKMLRPAVILLFGISPSYILPGTEPAHFVITDFEGVNLISAPELERLNQANEESRKLKSRLWQSLKQLFNVQ